MLYIPGWQGQTNLEKLPPKVKRPGEFYEIVEKLWKNYGS